MGEEIKWMDFLEQVHLKPEQERKFKKKEREKRKRR